MEDQAMDNRSAKILSGSSVSFLLKMWIVGAGVLFLMKLFPLLIGYGVSVRNILYNFWYIACGLFVILGVHQQHRIMKVAGAVMYGVKALASFINTAGKIFTSTTNVGEVGYDNYQEAMASSASFNLEGLLGCLFALVGMAFAVTLLLFFLLEETYGAQIAPVLIVLALLESTLNVGLAIFALGARAMGTMSGMMPLLFGVLSSLASITCIAALFLLATMLGKVPLEEDDSNGGAIGRVANIALISGVVAALILAIYVCILRGYYLDMAMVLGLGEGFLPAFFGIVTMVSILLGLAVSIGGSLVIRKISVSATVAERASAVSNITPEQEEFYQMFEQNKEPASDEKTASKNAFDDWSGY